MMAHFEFIAFLSRKTRPGNGRFHLRLGEPIGAFKAAMGQANGFNAKTPRRKGKTDCFVSRRLCVEKKF